MFSSRLQTLEALLEKAASFARQRERDPESLLRERLAPDMHPLAFQIVFTAEQPRQLAAFCAQAEAGPFVEPTTLTLEHARRLLQEVRARMQAVAGSPYDSLTRIKNLQLAGGLQLQLSGIDYLEEWLMPNFYFHLVTAYSILRHEGVPLGKADYMRHLAGHVRNSPGAQVERGSSR